MIDDKKLSKKEEQIYFSAFGAQYIHLINKSGPKTPMSEEAREKSRQKSCHSRAIEAVSLFRKMHKND